MNCRSWLRANGYPEVADMIEEILAEWRDTGNKQRRNWWAALAGRKDGTPIVVAGRQFPVLQSAQKRQELKVLKSALKRNRREIAPPIRVTNRWPFEDSQT